MKEFLLELEKLERTGSFLAKDDILIEVLDNFPEAETFFRIAFNDTVYGCDEKSFYKAFGMSIVDYNKQFGSFSDYIYSVKKQGDALGIKFLEACVTNISFSSGLKQLQNIKEMIDKLDALHAKWFSRAILKDLRCGVQLKTINKALESCGLKEIEKHSVQLCGKLDIYDDAEVKKRLKFPCTMEIKYDGTRIQAEVYEGVCKLTSRHGKDKTEQYPEIVKELEGTFGPNTHVILDGEIIAGNFQELSTRMHRNAGNLNEVSKIAFVVFDLLMDEKLDYRSRWDNLVELSDYFEESTLIVLAEHYDCNNIEDARAFYEEANKRKEEGIIIKLDNKPYERGSRKNMYKVKKIYDADLKCVAYNYGDGKKNNVIASLDLIDKSGKIECSVGSGITDEMAEQLTKMDADLYGKIIEIQYNEITETNSIRFPRFIRIRDDKTEPDDLSKVELRQ